LKPSARDRRETAIMHNYQLEFIDLAMAREALRFGRFTLKSGRESPYFFNAGLFSDGASAAALGRCYAAALASSGLEYDMLFGPAYKGIPLATATVIALADHHGRNVPYAFNRKEAKDHGEGGNIVGTALKGRVVIVDDVISDGAAKREAIDMIHKAGATPAAILLALDRQERGQGDRSAVQEIYAAQGVRCVSILTLGQLLTALENPPDGRARVSAQQLTALKAYRAQFGVP
jgi:orotate phosphoribosyltransferase